MGMNVLHRTVTKEDLASSFFTKLKQKHISAKEAAENMHLAQSTLSMWKEKKVYPINNLSMQPNIYKMAIFRRKYLIIYLDGRL